MAEAAFSENGKYYSSISQDGRLRIWDTETNTLKQEYTPDGHLTSPSTCLRWLKLSTNSSQSKTKRETEYIALGTTRGQILLYSVVQAQIETVLEDKVNEVQRKNITCLDWHREYGLYSCNKENIIQEWNITNASVRHRYNVNDDIKNKQSNFVSAIKIIPHHQNNQARFLVTASYQIRVWRLHNGESSVLKTLGHSTTPRALLCVANLQNKCWLVEGSLNERLLAFWDITVSSDHMPQVNGEEITPSKSKKKRKQSTSEIVNTPSYNFVLEDAPKCMDVTVKEDEGTKVTLVATTRSGVTHYYDHVLNGSSLKPIKPSLTIQVTTPDANPIPLQCCKIPPHGDLLLGYSHSASIWFERVAPDLNTKTQILIRGQKREKKSKASQNEDKQMSTGVSYVEPLGGVTRKREAPGAKVEVPMEQRLSNLALDTKSKAHTAVNKNLTKLLVQGLHSKDERILEMVLKNDNPSVALHTVASLPADYVAPLLEQLASMAAMKTSQCATTCTWVSALLRSHAALLLAAAGGQTADRLTHLLAIFTQRRSHLCQLLNLKGRLDLAMMQRKAATVQGDQEPLLEYNDSSSDEEMEVEGYHSDTSDVKSWADSDSEPPPEPGLHDDDSTDDE